MYAKVFEQIFDSSIADDRPLRHFFIDLLILADPNGVIDMTPNAIAGRTRWPIEEVKANLAKLETPDPESRSPDHDGRRIKRLDDHRTWGWCILNYEKFRQTTTEEQRRAKTRERVRAYRAKTKTVSDGLVTVCNAPVTQCNASNAKQKERQKERKTQKQTDKSIPPSAGDSAPQNGVEEKKPPSVWGEWIDANRKFGRKDPAATGPNTAASKQIGEVIETEKERRRIFENYLADNDPWICGQGHALCHLLKRIDAYRNKQTQKRTARTIEEAMILAEKGLLA